MIRQAIKKVFFSGAFVALVMAFAGCGGATTGFGTECGGWDRSGQVKNPSVSFGASTSGGYEPLSVSFGWSVTTYNGDAYYTAYLDPGDGTYRNVTGLSGTTFKYTTSNWYFTEYYTAKLLIKDSSGNSTTKSITIGVYPN